jgi:hypothetical protein
MPDDGCSIQRCSSLGVERKDIFDGQSWLKTIDSEHWDQSAVVQDMRRYVCWLFIDRERDDHRCDHPPFSSSKTTIGIDFDWCTRMISLFIHPSWGFSLTASSVNHNSYVMESRFSPKCTVDVVGGFMWPSRQNERKPRTRSNLNNTLPVSHPMG